MNGIYRNGERKFQAKLKQNENLQRDFSMEKYLSLPSHLHSALAKFRLSCHSLLIETGRYRRPPLYTT